MEKGISRQAKRELIEAVRQRYRRGSKREKTKILDEFAAVAGFHRKHVIRLLRGDSTVKSGSPSGSRRIYDEAVKQALTVLWETADRICGKRLKSILPSLIESMERFGHLDLEPSVRERLLSISAASIDRLLRRARAQTKSRKRRQPRAGTLRKQIPVRTFADWVDPEPGQFEIDFVAHNGGVVNGSFVHSLVATDVYSGWTESVPLLVREQSLVVEGLCAISEQFPVSVVAIDSDNDSAFINETLLNYCRRESIAFTRSRPYRKNDQAWIEQKNGAVVRRLVGYARFSGVVAAQALAQLFHAARLHVNYFQPSFKLKEKTREGSRVRKSYFKPATPCDRLLDHPRVTEDVKRALRSERRKLDPLKLLHRVRQSQAALAALGSPDLGRDLRIEGLDEFLAQLPRLWRAGEPRPTHQKRKSKPHYWRTRKDPFEGEWTEVLSWLQNEPEATAKMLFERLQQKHPGEHPNGQLRTLQRRIKEWRTVMARNLVFSCVGGGEVTAIGTERDAGNSSEDGGSCPGGRRKQPSPSASILSESEPKPLGNISE